MRNTPCDATKTAEACVQRASGPPPSVEEIFTRLSTGLQCFIFLSREACDWFLSAYRISSAPCEASATGRNWNERNNPFVGDDRGHRFAILRRRPNRQNGNHKMAIWQERSHLAHL